jgi:hypothetical protein
LQRRITATIPILASALALASCGYATPAEEAGDGPAKVERDDSDHAQVILKASAARRIGLATAPVRLAEVGGSVVVRGRASASGTTSRRSTTITVKLPARVLARVDANQSAAVLDEGRRLVAPPLKPAPGAAAGTLSYRLDGAAGTVQAGQAVRVELALRDGGQRKTVPYSAVIYWIDGGTWVYTQIGRLTYTRSRVAIADVDGNVAVLERGPPSGTRVVRVGAQELLGSEFEIEGE